MITVPAKLSDRTVSHPTQRIRVAHIITKLELGGAQQNTLYTVTHLDRTRFEVFLAFGPGGILTPEVDRIPDLTAHALRHLIRPIRPHQDLLASIELYRWFRRIKPHIVHTHSSKAGILGRLAAAAAGVPIIIHTIHGYGITPTQPRWLRASLLRAERLAARVTTHFITVSRENRRWGICQGLFKPQQSSLIRSGIHLPTFRAPPSPDRIRDLKQKYDLEDATHIVGMIACLKPQKAPLDFLRLARRLRRRHPRARFVLIGDGELRPRLESYIRRFNLATTVRLTGWQSHVKDWYNLFDCFVLTSLWEGLPRVLPEALAAGVPVVATAVNGNTEVIRHKKTGFLVRPHDIKSMARYVSWILSHPDKAKKMVQHAAPFLDEFDIDAMVKAQERLYDALYDRWKTENNK